jgi:hypothetical protein
VRDTGFGVASEDFEHVFAEFRQVGNGQAKHEGTGLGLSPIGRLDERPYLGQQPVEVGTAPLLAAGPVLEDAFAVSLLQLGERVAVLLIDFRDPCVADLQEASSNARRRITRAALSCCIERLK